MGEGGCGGLWGGPAGLRLAGADADGSEGTPSPLLDHSLVAAAAHAYPSHPPAQGSGVKGAADKDK